MDYFLSIQVNSELNNLITKFSEHYHDAWASRKLENGWKFGDQYSWNDKIHPRLKPYSHLSEYVSLPGHSISSGFVLMIFMINCRRKNVIKSQSETR